MLKNILLGIMTAALLGGCASGFETHYTPVSGSTMMTSTNVQTCPTPKVEKFPAHMSADVIEKQAYERGYVLIGKAHWKSTVDESDDNALLQGQKVGACFVAWRRADAGVIHTTRTVSEYTPPQQKKVTTYTRDGRKEVKVVEVPGETRYREVPVSYQQYDFIGLFFGKASANPSSLGIISAEPPVEFMAKNDSRAGVLVTSVIANSNAYTANIFPGDIIMKVNNATVYYDTPISLMPNHENTVEIYRNGKIMVKKIYVK